MVFVFNDYPLEIYYLGSMLVKNFVLQLDRDKWGYVLRPTDKGVVMIVGHEGVIVIN